MASGRPVSLSPSTTTNKAAKNTSKCQSINLSTSCVSRRASTITRTAPESAVHARFSPATKAGKDREKHDANDRKQTAVEFRDDVDFTFDGRRLQRTPKTETQNDEIDCQSNDRRRRKRSRELRKGNMRKMPNNHV